MLLADDEELVRRAAQRMLTRLGYNVLVAEDGLTALETYRQHQDEIAVVLLDVVMPVMNGFETLRRLKEIDPEVCVVLCSGYSADEGPAAAGSDGAAGYVKKPFHLADLRRLVARLA